MARAISAAAARRALKALDMVEDNRGIDFNRLSRADDFAMNLADQSERNCRGAVVAGIELISRLVEEDESAFLEKARTVFWELDRLLIEGMARHVFVVRIDRLSRNPTTFQAVSARWAQHAVVIHESMTGDVYRLARPSDLRRLNDKVQEAWSYSMAISLGVEAAHARQREHGVHAGSIPSFGWLDPQLRTIDESLAPLIVEAYERIFEGVSLSRIADDWTLHGVLTPHQRWWRAPAVTKLIEWNGPLDPAYADLRDEAIARSEEGERPNVIAHDWNYGDLGRPGPKSIVASTGWNGSMVRRVLTAPRVCGLVWDFETEKFIQGDPTALNPKKRGIQPIVSREQWELLCAFLQLRRERTKTFDRPRGAYGGSTAWESGLVYCTKRIAATYKSGPRAGQPHREAGQPCDGRLYKTVRGGLQCRRCRRTFISRARLTEVLVDRIIDHITAGGLDAIAAELRDNLPQLAVLRSRIAHLEVELASTAKLIQSERERAQREDRPAALRTLNRQATEIEQEIGQLRVQYIDLIQSTRTYDPDIANSIRERWEAADDEWRRGLVNHIVDRIECLPSRDADGSRRRTDERIVIWWRTDRGSISRAA